MSEKFLEQDMLKAIRLGLRSIGYSQDLLIDNYPYADFFSPFYSVSAVDLAAFAQQPPSYRTACFGIVVSRGERDVSKYSALGAPHLIDVDVRNGETRLWQITGNRHPDLVERIHPDELFAAFERRSEEWNPESLLRAKSLDVHFSTSQPDLFDFGLIPIIERQVNQKLDELFGLTIGIATKTYYENHGKELNSQAYQGLFRLLFRLIVAKLLADRQYPGNWSDTDVKVVLGKVEKFYFRSARPERVLNDYEVQQAAWDSIRNSFHLQNLSLEALAYVYENTFVSVETRRKYGTHATPPEVAEFIVRSLPFESIENPTQRTVFEPFCGHAPFLTAALGRLRSLLGSTLNAQERHNYLIRMLMGMELDSFAREVARYSLILADYPNPDGWKIDEDDVFESKLFAEHLQAANIVLSNPPYASFSAEERKRYTALRSPDKAAEALLRVLDNPPLMLGFLLPRSFIDSRIYRTARQQLADAYEEISLIALPDNAFRYSEVETAIVMAHGTIPKTKRVWYSSFVAKQDYDKFALTGAFTWSEREEVQVPIPPDPQLWQTPLYKQLHKHIAGLPVLGEYVDIHQGVQYLEPVKQYVSDRPQLGYIPGIHNVSDGLEPYVVRDHKYLRVSPELMRRKAHERAWDKPKVIVNAARISRGAWRILAAVDEQGLLGYQRFHAIWSKGELSIQTIAAILNGPLANAFLAVNLPRRDNTIHTLKNVPVPRLSYKAIEEIDVLVDEYRSVVNSVEEQVMIAANHFEKIRHLLLRIDQIVLEAYQLPTDFYSKLLGYFVFPSWYGAQTIPRDVLSERYRHFVDKSFLGSLSTIEVREYNYIDYLLEQEDAEFYNVALSRLEASLSSSGTNGKD
jgi:hypothetical protein